MKKKKKKTNAQLIIDVLMDGKDLRSRNISDMITERQIKIQDVASMLSKISDENRCELGHFIIKVQDDRGIYVYNMVKEIRKLPREKVYDLTRKTGKNRYTLDKAMEEIPALRKYVRDETEEKEAEPKKKAAKMKGRPAKPAPGKVSDTKADIDTDKLASEIIQKLVDLVMNAKVNVSLDFDK
ncbi:MAG: hypothetical protein GY795_31670 [Desulfobacterales bacterium]|nr:hypothetical protein [Desulfobacterales bacterium]